MDKAALDSIGREMRRRLAEEPKGGIPDRLWRLLLALEARTTPLRPAQAPAR